MQPGTIVISPVTNASYQVLEPIGTGTYATCYAALNTSTNDPICIKQIHYSSLDEKNQQFSAREAQLHATLVHPSIITFHEAFFTQTQQETSLLIILQLSSCSLQDHIQLRKTHNVHFQIIQILFLFLDIIQSIAYLHARHVTHRDVASKNLLCFFAENDDKGEKIEKLKLCDFGVSNVSNGLCETQIGTPQTMAPEIFDNAGYDEKCDIWSCGCVFYEILTLRGLFEGMNLIQIVGAMDGFKVEIPGDLDQVYKNAEFLGFVQGIIGKMLQKSPEKRPSAEQLELEILEQIQQFSSKKVSEKVYLDFDGVNFIKSQEQPFSPVAFSPKNLEMRSKSPVLSKELPGRLKKIDNKQLTLQQIKQQWKQSGQKGGQVEIISGLTKEIEDQMNNGK